MDTQNSQKRSPRSSATKNRKHVRFGADEDAHEEDFDDEQYLDRTLDHVARVRAAKQEAQRKIEEFGDVSEYDITVIYGQLRRDSKAEAAQPSLDFEREGEA